MNNVHAYSVFLRLIRAHCLVQQMLFLGMLSVWSHLASISLCAILELPRQETCGCGIEGHGLVGMVVMG